MQSVGGANERDLYLPHDPNALGQDEISLRGNIGKRGDIHHQNKTYHWDHSSNPVREKSGSWDD